MIKRLLISSLIQNLDDDYRYLITKFKSSKLRLFRKLNYLTIKWIHDAKPEIYTTSNTAKYRFLWLTSFQTTDILSKWVIRKTSITTIILYARRSTWGKVSYDSISINTVTCCVQTPLFKQRQLQCFWSKLDEDQSLF